jgi:hypothetical protein
MTAFDRAWSLLKMPYYHGTSSANIDSILEHGIRPGEDNEGNWGEWWGDNPYWNEDNEAEAAAFMAAEPTSALSYALGNINTPSNDIGLQTPEHRPVVFEISDDAEGLEGFDFNPMFHDFKVREPIPPEMLRLVHEGENYPDMITPFDLDDGYDMEGARRHGEQYDLEQSQRLKDSDWFKQYMAMGDKRHPPFILREGLY